MGQVFINGELVEFEGDAPRTCQEACSLIEGFLSGQGLAIGEVELDGASLSLEEAAGKGEYERLSFTSISPQLQLLEMCRRWKDETASLVEAMDELSGAVLRSGWSESQQQVVDFLEKLRPVVEGVGVLQQFGSDSGSDWTAEVNGVFQGGLGAIDEIVSAVEARDCVLLSDRLAEALSGRWSEVARCLEGVVIPSLEKEFSS
ncbi:hypothetical protein [Pelagicoccus sp. SDUM812005]|uniref:hypothetical protein n=1 Tax=Pelagicoccus sp. SDUM812005 TaxID=3041257 RepID=UPI00280CE00B|nr:hypothetical protein [Pelagicoccus sp. SDUM812005]MDQ8180428.1 hypothetical protein [Pelagicoccus sp. SDUM812005]